MRSATRLLPSRRLACAALLAALAASACGDLPTGADSYVREAGGATWVAIVEPVGLPDARTWLPFVPPGSPALAAVRQLQAEAGKARRAGRAEEALALDAEAARAAAAALGAAPPPQVALGAVAALESWVQRAEARLATGSFPELAAAAERVRAERDAARGLLAAGDTNAAVLALARAAEAARELSPLAVALRAIGAAEARIRAYEAPSEELRRAARLLRAAREGIATGDNARSLQRVLYAIQLIDAEDRFPPSSGRGKPPQPAQ
jgi:hypothetical protein